MLSEKAMKIKCEFEEIVEAFVKNYSMDMYNEMSAEDFLMIQKSMILMKDSMDFMVKYAETMDEINRKLDRLLESK